MKKIWPLVAPPTFNAAISDAVTEVLLSGNMTMGVRVREFEEKFACLVGSKYSVMVNSGSSANLLAVACMFYHPDRPLKRGDVAVVPSISWATTYAPLAQFGLKLLVTDCDVDTLGSDVNEIEQAIDELKTKPSLIVGISVLGEPSDMHELRLLADRHKVWFWEDNCESFGSTVRCFDVLYQQCGTFGDIGTFSTFFSHHLSTVEGGMMVTDDPLLYQLALCLRSHGWVRDMAPECHLLHGLPPSPFSGAYTFLLPGFNIRPTEFQAAIGLANLSTLDTQQFIRRENACLFDQRIRKKVDGYGYQCFDVLGKSIPFGFVIIARDKEHRARTLRALDVAGIEYRMVTGGCFSKHPYSGYFEWTPSPNDLAYAEYVHECGFFVGNHAVDLSSEIELLRDTLGKVD